MKKVLVITSVSLILALAFFAAYKILNNSSSSSIEKDLQTCINTIAVPSKDLSTVSPSNDNSFESQLLKKTVKKTGFKILEVKDAAGNQTDTKRVIMEVSAINMGEVMKNAFQNYVKDMETVNLESATIENIEEIFRKNIEKEYDKAAVSKKTVDIEIVKMNGKWTPAQPYEWTDIVTGGFLSSYRDILLQLGKSLDE